MKDIKTGIYKHFKGKESLVVAVAQHSDSEEEFVIYKGLQDGKFHARPVSSFIEQVEYNGKKVPRFELIKEVVFDFEIGIEKVK